MFKIVFASDGILTSCSDVLLTELIKHTVHVWSLQATKSASGKVLLQHVLIRQTSFVDYSGKYEAENVFLFGPNQMKLKPDVSKPHRSELQPEHFISDK